ncbi:MAG: hypothetical protein WCI73_18900, partial [Phycisphaerae bacterium]
AKSTSPTSWELSHLFSGFRLAINPAKIIIGVLAIVLIYLSALAFDFVWGPQVYEGEIDTYQKSYSAETFRQLRTMRLEQRQSELTSLLTSASDSAPQRLTFTDAGELAHSPRAAYRTLRRLYELEFSKALDTAAEQRKTDETFRARGGSSFGADNVPPAEVERLDRIRAAKALQGHMTNARQAVGKGIMESFLAYELRQFDALVDNTLSLIRVGQIRPSAPGDIDMLNDNNITAGIVSRKSERLFKSDTLVGCVANMTITGPWWMISSSAPAMWRPDPADAGTWSGLAKIAAYRGLYWLTLAILLAFWLAVLAVSGGIITRLSALEFAGYDKAGLLGVWHFVRQRFWTFIKAPLMPLGILLFLGILLALLGLVGAVPFVGELLLGLAFIIFLAIGFIMMLLTLAILGGMHLLYPTIATEGSDGFDAMSRGFAYVYSRPWRLIGYSLLSLIYGVITFLFVSMAVYLLLVLTHTFAAWGTNLLGYNHAWYSGTDKLDALWPAPRFFKLWPDVNWWAMSWTEWVGAGMLHGWLFLLFAALGGYVMSYYYSANTIIYFLLRRSVDGQSLSDIAPPEEEAQAEAPPPATTPVATTEPTPPAPN